MPTRQNEIRNEVNRRVALGNQLLKSNRSQAKEHFNVVLKLDPINFDALQGLALCAFSDAEYERTVKCLQTIVEVDESNAEVLKLAGRIQFRWLEAFADAEKTFRQALELDRNDLDAQAYLGLALLGLAKTTRPRDCLTT